MRIVQIVHALPPDAWAGTELVTLHLAKALHARGHHVTVVARTTDPQAAEFSTKDESRDGLDIVWVVNNSTYITTFRASYDNPFCTRPLLRILERVQPDVVHFQHVAHLSARLLPFAAALGYPTVLSLHDFFFPRYRLHLINDKEQLCPGPGRGERCVPCLQEFAPPDEARRRFAFMEYALRAPRVILAGSAFVAEKIQRDFPETTAKLRVIPLGVPVMPRRQARNGRPAQLRILVSGVLLPHKGAHVLLEALRGLEPRRFSVSIYGAVVPYWQSYVDRLHAMAADLPVEFHPAYPHSELDAILARHDVVIMPGICEETLSLFAREALLAGLPVVAARRGALPDIVQHEVNGLLFEPENSVDLRRCLARLLTEPALLEQLRCAVPQVKAMDEYAGEMEAVYSELIVDQRARRQAEAAEQGSLSSLPVVSTSDDTGGKSPLSALSHKPGLSWPKKEGAYGAIGLPTVAGEATLLTSVQANAVRVSVCLPTYNGAAFLAESIRSILAQSFTDFELLVVDDGSTDSTLDIVRSFSDPRVHLHQNPQRLGIPGNWNRCLELAHGEYVCVFHQDDVMLPENLERKVEVLKADPTVSVVHSAVEVVMEETAPSAPPTGWIEPAREDFVVAGDIYFRKLLMSNQICAPAVMVRRSQVAAVGGFDPTLGFAPDYDMWLKLCVLGRVAFLSQPLVLYRWHSTNASHGYRFACGVEEALHARQQALRFYEQKTGRTDETVVLSAAITAVAKAERHAAQLDQQSARQLVYIRELEQTQGKLWADVEKVGKSWEEQKAHIENQQAYIQSLEQERAWWYAERDQLLGERDQLLGERDQLLNERDRLITEQERSISRRLRRLAKRLWLLVRPA